MFLGKSDKPKTVAVPDAGRPDGTRPTTRCATPASNPFSGTPEPFGGPCPGVRANLAEGKVCTQDPAADSRADEGHRDHVHVYKKPTVTVPRRGMQFADAEQRCTIKGLKAGAKK